MTFEIDDNNNLSLARIIDSESSFGATKKGINPELSKIWIPAIPAEDETFRTGPYKMDGFDANLMYLVIEYPEIVFPMLKEFTDTNYDHIIKRYQETEYSGPVTLSDEGIDYLKKFIDDKQEESERIRKVM